MKSVRFDDRESGGVFATEVFNEDPIEVLPFHLISEALWHSCGNVVESSSWWQSPSWLQPGWLFKPFGDEKEKHMLGFLPP